MKLFLLQIAYAFGLDNGLARTPPMGWLSWERFGCETDCAAFPHSCISERLYLEMAEQLVSHGLDKLGYRYVNIDDCWSSLNRNSDGSLSEDKIRFPSGMADLGQRIHSLGLLFGMYTDIGAKTCGGYPGIDISRDVDQFVSQWQIDSLKVDGCYANVTDMKRLYSSLGAALNSTGRPVLYSCSWPAYQSDHCENEADMATLVKECNLWRNFDDVYDSWSSVRSIVDYWARESTSDILVRSAGPGHWNDPDMLLVGNPGLSISEQRAQMALWAILAAPLYISADLRTISAESLAILTNAEVIAINQDAHGTQGYVLTEEGNYRVWVRPLGKRFAVLFENKASIFGAIRFRFNISQLGWTTGSHVTVRDVHAHNDLAVGEDGSFTVDVDESSVEMFVFTKREEFTRTGAQDFIVLYESF